MYDTIIIGGGPAGIAAGVYAARKQLRTVFITKEWGGQSVVSPDVQNWIGTPSIPGAELAKNLKTHLETVGGETVEIIADACVTRAEKKSVNFTVTLDNGKMLESRTLLITSGARRRKLEVPGAKEFDQKGLTYCASCDGPLFSGQDVAVIGGGNAGFETAAQLLAYTKSVTLLHYRDEFKADPVTVQKVLKNPKMKAIMNASTTAILGDKFVTGLKYKDTVSGEEKELNVTGVFVEVGLLPNTGFLGNLLELDEFKRIKVDPRNQRASVEGVWAAGDCTDGLFHQNNIAAGDAVKAIEDIYNFLHTKQ
ncbi:FAD-dependent oxidoreductase [Candidatus Kaiserbacteria bacterium]|nr:FAD-dependent oxidoreductase [Candidatus Kaiserbacteria bacterium]